MAMLLNGVRVAVLAADGVEEEELDFPCQAVQHAGADVQVISVTPGTVQAFEHLDRGNTFPIHKQISEAQAKDYKLIIIPGGRTSVQTLRTSADAVRFVRACAVMDMPIAAIGYGPGLLVEADVVRGRTLTSAPSLQTEIRNAGGTWVDQPTQVDQKLLTGRGPQDLRTFCAKLIDLMTSTIHNALIDEASQESFPASDAPAWGPTTIGKTGEQRSGDDRRSTP